MTTIIDFLRARLTWFNALMTNPVFYGSAAHFLGGYGVIMTCDHFSSKLLPRLVVWALFVVVTAVKEFWYDIRYEIPQQDVKGGTRDFLSYQAGALFGFIVSLL